MVKKFFVCVLISFTLGLIGCEPGTEPEPEPKPEPGEVEEPIWPPADESENIWTWPAEVTDGTELYKYWSFPLGVAVPGASTSNASNNNALDISNPQYPLLKNFNVVVAENEMKPSNMLPSSANGAYGRKTNADQACQLCQSNGQKNPRSCAYMARFNTVMVFSFYRNRSGKERKTLSKHGKTHKSGI